MSREQLEAPGYTFVESDLPSIVREWSIDDADHESWKKLRPHPVERVLAGYWIFGGRAVIEEAA